MTEESAGSLEQTQVEVAKPVKTTVKFDRQGGLQPTTFEELWRMATAFASSGMVPKAYDRSPEACFVAGQMGAEMGISFAQSIQNIAVINGKPGIYGDLGKALLLQAGCIIDEDDTVIVQKNKRARCKITRPGRPPVERTFSTEDAITAGLWGKTGPWTTYPYRQMAWRAFWFAARDCAADLLRGMRGAEELADIPAEREVQGSAEFVEQPRRVGDPASAPQGAGSAATSQAAGAVSSTVSSPAGAEADTDSTGTAETTLTGAHQKAPPSAPTQNAEPLPEKSSGDSPKTTELTDEGGPRLSESQIKILKARLVGAALTEIDVQSKFGRPLSEMPVNWFNEVVTWVKNPF